MFAFTENLDTVLSYLEYFSKTIDYFLGKNQEPPENFQRKDYENFISIVEPIAKDNGSMMNITAHKGANLYIGCSFSSVEANAIQNQASKEIKKAPICGLHKKVLLRWSNAKNQVGAKTGNASIIENILPFPVKTVFNDEKLQKEILFESENPFNYFYIVDVEVSTVEEKPILYKITSLHEKFEKA
jgi:hypothetical protein